MPHAIRDKCWQKNYRPTIYVLKKSNTKKEKP